MRHRYFKRAVRFVINIRRHSRRLIMSFESSGMLLHMGGTSNKLQIKTNNP